MFKNKKLIIGIIAFIILAGAISMFSRKEKSGMDGSRITDNGPRIEYYTCGMHPSVRVSEEEFNKGNVNCPICNMKLTPVYKETTKAKKDEVYYGCGVNTEGKCPHCDLGKPDSRCICGEHTFVIAGEKINCPVCNQPLRELTMEEADRLIGVVSRVSIRREQTKLAGIGTGFVKKLHLYKEIRTVGRVAYDPGLAIAQEEFISSIRTLDKMQEGGIAEIKERAQKLVEASKRKLKLLGLSDEQIEDMEIKKKVQTNLVLPEETMWVYGEVYEYELSWVKIGLKVKVTTSSFAGEEFSGIISSINPVLDPKTRSVRFRAQVNNPNLRLQPEMYVDVIIISMYEGTEGENEVLAIPKEAVLDTGMRKIVWVDKGNGEYEGREVRIGPEATATINGKKAKYYPVLRGLSEGEQVVTKANFLIDSQSQISGVAASVYGGVLGAEEKPKGPQLHQH